MITAEISGEDRIAVKSTYEMRDRNRFKSIAGAKFKNNGWTVPLTWAACQQLRGMFGHELTVGPALADWSTRTAAEQVNPALALREATELTPDRP